MHVNPVLLLQRLSLTLVVGEVSYLLGIEVTVDIAHNMVDLELVVHDVQSLADVLRIGTLVLDITIVRFEGKDLAVSQSVHFFLFHFVTVLMQFKLHNPV